ncbi:hypothetical protein [Methyloceanibacter caenitepidi]|uniref:Uncharacterized protein n=1 Tax=Methyloceanibacter caenitepidi TaxID=1384459 RepID=A0A0A8JZP1_9HYPH|nr:hypothetical protein [Methyloceanibacter caenitepidi]BAQ15861.1 hypothetical protein GL4_0393 [Methyloceanibacter caenitepidi]
MRIAIATLVIVGAVWLAAAPAHAAPVPLTGTAADTIAEDAGSLITTVAKRKRKTVRQSTRNCGWQCKRYYRPYQYRYWKFYYPYGGPLFYSRR